MTESASRVSDLARSRLRIEFARGVVSGLEIAAEARAPGDLASIDRALEFAREVAGHLEASYARQLAADVLDSNESATYLPHGREDELDEHKNVC